MTLSTSKRLGALALMAVLAIGACSSSGASTAPSAGATTAASEAPAGSAAPESPAADLSGTVTIDGSSTVFPITQAVAEDFQNANPGVQVPVAVLGHRRRLQEVLRRRDRYQRRLAADQGRGRG